MPVKSISPILVFPRLARRSPAAIAHPRSQPKRQALRRNKNKGRKGSDRLSREARREDERYEQR
jgi:hypothetical protein